MVASRVRRGREFLRPWIDGRLRMEERAAAVGSVLIACSSVGSRQILNARGQLRREMLLLRARRRFRASTRQAGKCLGMTYWEAHGAGKVTNVIG